MYKSQTQIRVHYALTDPMGVVYHSHYAEFFEIGRTEAFRDIGATYKELEAAGIIMPVTELHIKYFKPARYDDLLTITNTIRELPRHHKTVFYSEVFNDRKELLCNGYVNMYIIDSQTMKRCSLPESLIRKLEPYFAEEQGG